MGAGRGGGDACQTDEQLRWGAATVLGAAGVPCGPVYNYAQMFADSQMRHRGLVLYASDTPIKIGESVRVRTVAPKLGQHKVSEIELGKLRAQGVV